MVDNQMAPIRLAKPIIRTLLPQPNCVSLNGRPHSGHATAFLLTEVPQSGHVVNRTMSLVPWTLVRVAAHAVSSGIDNIVARGHLHSPGLPIQETSGLPCPRGLAAQSCMRGARGYGVGG